MFWIRRFNITKGSHFPKPIYRFNVISNKISLGLLRTEIHRLIILEVIWDSESRMARGIDGESHGTRGKTQKLAQQCIAHDCNPPRRLRQGDHKLLSKMKRVERCRMWRCTAFNPSIHGGKDIISGGLTRTGLHSEFKAS